jgi:transposase
VTNGTSIYSLSKQFQISSRSIRRWIEKYQQTNSVSREKREVEAYKVYDAHVKYAIAYLRNHPTTTITDLHNHLKQMFTNYNITQQWL